MLNKPTSGFSVAVLLNKSSCLVATLGVNKFIKHLRIQSHFNVRLKSDLDVSQTHLELFSKTYKHSLVVFLNYNAEVS
jgi:hypothetical protein